MRWLDQLRCRSPQPIRVKATDAAQNCCVRGMEDHSEQRVLPAHEEATALLRRSMDRTEAALGCRVVAIVLTWNSAGYVQACLQSLTASSVPVSVVVVDNGSVDQTMEEVKSFDSEDLVIVETGENLGYAGGNNIGLRIADAADADIAVLINPDATLSDNCVEALVKATQEDPDVGLVSPVICYQGRVLFAGSNIEFPSGASHTFATELPCHALAGPPYATGRPNGCVMAVRLSHARQVGYMDERYFLYYEETDFALRLREQGVTVKVAPEARAQHDPGHGKHAQGMRDATYHYYMTRNRLVLASLHSPFGIYRTIPHVVRTNLYDLLLSVRRDRSQFVPYLKAMAAGYRDFVVRRRGPRSQHLY